jgi:hypothetical protein
MNFSPFPLTWRKTSCEYERYKLPPLGVGDLAARRAEPLRGLALSPAAPQVPLLAKFIESPTIVAYGRTSSMPSLLNWKECSRIYITSPVFGVDPLGISTLLA